MEIRLQNLTKKYLNRNRKNPGEITAVSDFTLKIPDGMLVGLLGPSGCGKSTTLNMICGLEHPSSGRIFFGDRDVTELLPEYRGVGMVFQNYALYPHLTVRKNVLFPLENLRGKERLSKAEMARRADEAAAMVQIGELMDRKPGELSGGQQQRVAIARALVKMPHVLLMDEPLSNLDARLRLQTREEIRKIQRSTKITTVFVTHDQEEAMSISDMIVVMKEGVVQQIGKPQEIYDDPVNLFVARFLGTPPINLFEGQICDGKIVIGNTPVLNAADAAGMEPVFQKGNCGPRVPVTVAVRPEGFVPCEDGELSCALQRVEVMGRDISIVAEHPACETSALRAIVDASALPAPEAKTVKFSLKPEKVFLFCPETGERIRRI